MDPSAASSLSSSASLTGWWRVQSALLSLITEAVPNETQHHLVELYRSSRSLVDVRLLEDHLRDQWPLLALLGTLSVFATLCALFALTLALLRACGYCGSRRYQKHPTSGRRFLALFMGFMSLWLCQLVCTLLSFSAGLAFWTAVPPTATILSDTAPMIMPTSSFPSASHLIRRPRSSVHQRLYGGEAAAVPFRFGRDYMPAEPDTEAWEHAHQTDHIILSDRSPSPSRRPSPTPMIRSFGRADQLIGGAGSNEIGDAIERSLDEIGGTVEKSVGLGSRSQAILVDQNVDRQDGGDDLLDEFEGGQWRHEQETLHSRADKTPRHIRIQAAPSQLAETPERAPAPLDSKDIEILQPRIGDGEGGEKAPSPSIRSSTAGMIQSELRPLQAHLNIKPIHSRTITTSSPAIILDSERMRGDEDVAITRRSTSTTMVPSPPSSRRFVSIGNESGRELEEDTSIWPFPTNASWSDELRNMGDKDDEDEDAPTIVVQGERLVVAPEATTTTTTTTTTTPASSSSQGTIATTTPSSTRATTTTATTTPAMSTTTRSTRKEKEEAEEEEYVEFGSGHGLDELPGGEGEKKTAASTTVSTTSRLLGQPTTPPQQGVGMVVETSWSRQWWQAFESLHTAGVRLSIQVLFCLTCGLQLAVLSASLVLATTGAVCYVRSYHPIDRSRVSHVAGKLAIGLSFLQLFATPLVLLVVLALILYSHVHFALCPRIQLELQLDALEQTGSTSDLGHLDETAARALNEAHCMRSIQPVVALWWWGLWWSCFSVPAALLLLRLSKYWCRMRTEYYWTGAVTLGDSAAIHAIASMDDDLADSFSDSNHQLPVPFRPAPNRVLAY